MESDRVDSARQGAKQGSRTDAQEAKRTAPARQASTGRAACVGTAPRPRRAPAPCLLGRASECGFWVDRLGNPHFGGSQNQEVGNSAPRPVQRKTRPGLAVFLVCKGLCVRGWGMLLGTFPGDSGGDEGLSSERVVAR